jgi:hypothetical protein
MTDLTQSKLSRVEWDSIEIPESDAEKQILQMIIQGYSDVNVRKNDTLSMFAFIKIEMTAENELYLYKKYFHPLIEKIQKKYGAGVHPTNPDLTFPAPPSMTAADTQLKKIKSIDSLRLQNLESTIQEHKENIFEFVIIDLCQNMCKYMSLSRLESKVTSNGREKRSKYSFYLYTLIQLKKANIRHMNKYVVQYMDSLIEYVNQGIELGEIIERAYDFIERNPHILKYEDMVLYPHQKQLFSIFRKKTRPSNLVLYTAPTGTGKTLSPIGLAAEYRVIFVCVARHIGLALAKSAITMEKKIAFAFGCETASDIRLHYFAAVDYTRDRRSGGIRKVDNLNGSKVEIMICDVKSYLPAMYYMLNFNPKERIITYWDEPTITMDYETHPLHSTIHENWVKNQIPNVVLSCATLPREIEIMATIADFKETFENAEIHSIVSFDCKKSIPVLNKDGYCALPHNVFAEYEELMASVEYCLENQTMLRYFDLSEIVRFIVYVNSNNNIAASQYAIQDYFASISDITMNSLKTYYLKLLQNIAAEHWITIRDHIKTTQMPKFPRKVAGKSEPVASGILLTTADAYTLTDGPTIFMTNQPNTIGQFYIQQSNIPATVFQGLMASIQSNHRIMERIVALEKTIEDKTGASSSNTSGSKTEKDVGGISRKNSKPVDETKDETVDLRKLMKDLEILQSQIIYISLDTVYIPNTKLHQQKWAPEIHENAFIASIDEYHVKRIMEIDIENYLKILLLIGIGVFMNDPNPKYMDVMKTLAVEQRLFMIVASTDYIYGTNYQFCHGIIGKDLTNMTQQKMVQSLGRIGRNKIQQTYTVRVRDDAMITQLLTRQLDNREAVNMSMLFCR